MSFNILEVFFFNITRECNFYLPLMIIGTLLGRNGMLDVFLCFVNVMLPYKLGTYPLIIFF